jgi:outer membrane protein TolC
LRVEIEMPLDGWTGERAALHQQQRQERELRIRMRGQEVDLERQVRELRRGIEVQVRTVDLNEKRLDAERSKFAATEASYRTGRVDNLELTRARESLDTAEVNLLESRIDLVLALAGRDALLPPVEQR